MCSDRKIDKYYNFGIIFGPFFSFLPKIVFSANTKQRKKLKLYSLKKKKWITGYKKKLKRGFIINRASEELAALLKVTVSGNLIEVYPF